MDSLPQIPERNYRPHPYETRLHCCKRVRESRWPIWKVAQYYHVKKPSLYRWLKRYDQRGEGALRDLPHRPKSPHPASIPKGAAYKIKCLSNKSKSNGMSSVEIWVKANAQTGLSMCYMTVLRQLKRLDGYAPYKTNPKRHCKKYHTPEHNGKVERSHRIDQEKFYRTLLFHSLKDLREQGARLARRYNEMPRMTLKLRSPNQAELELLRALMDTTGEVRCPKLLKRLTSFVS